MSISIEHLKKNYRGFAAVDDVSIEIPSGSVFGLLGPNGAGKTTTFKCVLGLTGGWTGSVRFDGKPLEPQTFERLAYVPERSALYEWMTAGDHLAMQRGTFSRYSQQRAAQLMESFSLDPRKRVRAMSKGMRTALSVVLAFAIEPEIMVLDEPTGGLDPVNQRAVLKLIIDASAQGCTIVLSSHQIGQVERAADHIAVLRAGKVCLAGAVDDLKAGSKIVEGVFPSDAPALNGLGSDTRVTRLERTGRIVRVTVSDAGQTFAEQTRCNGRAKRADRRPEPRRHFFERCRRRADGRRRGDCVMVYFVEYMRAKGALRIALILLGLALLAAIIVRLSVHGAGVNDWASTIETSPTAHVTRTQLPDGSTRILVDDPARRRHAIITKHNGSVVMDIREPGSSSDRSHDNVVMGSMDVNTSSHGGVSHVMVHYNPRFSFDLGLLFLATIPMGLLVGTILAGPLAKENDGHLELAWTKPISRERYAVQAFGIDVLAIALSQACTFAIILLGTLLFIVPGFTYPAGLWWYVVLAAVGPIAWYGVLTAASSSLKRGPGLVIGLGWFFAIFIPAIAGALEGAARVNSVAAGFHAIFRALSYLDPIAYLSIKSGPSTATSLYLGASWVTVAALAALAIVYLAVSVVQWRRVEA